MDTIEYIKKLVLLLITVIKAIFWIIDKVKIWKQQSRKDRRHRRHA